jgi:DNA-binding NarL/FixJ family response regulator
MKDDPLAAALEAHLAALSSQNQMREAAVVRGQAIRDAITAGYTTKEIAAHLGVSQRRAQAMARTTKEQA